MNPLEKLMFLLLIALPFLWTAAGDTGPLPRIGTAPVFAQRLAPGTAITGPGWMAPLPPALPSTWYVD